jgi:phage regulator Rha-like protein
MGMRIPPFAFTEHGILMLASVLNSESAIQVNIRIVRIFAKMRELLNQHQEIIEIVKQLEFKFNNHDDKILLIFEYLRQFEQSRQQQEDQANRKRIGFRRDED